MVGCRSGGKLSAIRPTVDATSVVCIVVSTRWPGLGGGQRDAHRVRVAHLADDDHVRRLADDGAKRRGEVRRVGADLHLLDQALVVGVLVLDRVLDRDDVAAVAPVDLVARSRRAWCSCPDPVAPPMTTRPCGIRDSISTPAGRFRLARRGTRVGSARIVAAGRPRS